MREYQKTRSSGLRKLWKKLNLYLWPYQAHILSYPKSGRTWVRLLVGEALCHQFDLPHSMVLKTQVLTVRAGLLKSVFGHDGTALSSHVPAGEYLSRKEKYADTKVILFTRNVKDLLVSAYYQARYREKVYDGSISEFIRDDRYGVEKILTFYRDWEQHKHIPKAFELMSYEDFHENTHAALEDLLTFIGLENPRQESIRYAVQQCEFQKMRRREETDVLDHNTLRPGQAGMSDSYKTRRGKVGGYRDDLSTEDIEYVDERVASSGISFVTS